MALDSDTDALPTTRAVGAHRALEARRARLSTAHTACAALCSHSSAVYATPAETTCRAPLLARSLG